MDPVSIAASAVGTADVTFRLVRFLTRTLKGARDVNKDLRSLLSQMKCLNSINGCIHNITCVPDFEETLLKSFHNAGSLSTAWEQLWFDTNRILKETKRNLERLEELMNCIQGKSGHTREQRQGGNLNSSSSSVRSIGIQS